MAIAIKIKRSSTSNVPTMLEYGELAYSMGTDASKLYFGTGVDTGGGVMEAIAIGGKYYTDKIDSGITLGSTNIALGGTSSSIEGLSSITFAGSTSGNSTLNAQAVAGSTTFVLPVVSGTLVGSGDVGTITNTMLAGSIANEKLLNSSITINGSNISLGDSVTLYGNLSVSTTPAENAFGDLSYDSETGVLTLTKVTTANIQSVLSASNSGTGYGSLAYADGVFTFTKVTDADIRGAFTAGTGISITDGVIANTGVTSAVAGTGVSVSGATGAVTFSIGQAVGTTDTVTFGSVTVGDGSTTGGILTAGAGTLTIDPVLIGDNTGTVIIAGNLQVDGTTTTVNSVTLEVSDKNIVIAKGSVDATAANGAGLTVEGPTTAATLTYSSADDRWNFNKDLNVATVYGSLSGNASTATALETSRSFSVSGDATTSSAVSFNGTGNVDLAITLADGAVTSAKLAVGSVELATNTVTGILPVANGGTGASTLASGQLLIGAGTDPVTTDAALTWDSANDALTVGGATIATDASGVVTISTTTTDADIIISPNGAGSVTLATNSIIFDSDGDGVVESAVGDSMTIRGDTGLILEATNNDITMTLPAGTTSKVTISGPTAEQYSTGISDNDLVTANWVQTVALDGGTY